MKKDFSKSWVRSTQKRKQRKYVFNAPLHIKSKMIKSHLSKDLRKKYSRRSMRPIKGDKIKICRGQFYGKTGKIEKVDLKTMKCTITGIEFLRKDGNKVQYPIHATNLEIIDLNLDDKKRKEILERKTKK